MIRPTRLLPAMLIAVLAGSAFADSITIDTNAPGYNGANGGGAFVVSNVSGYAGLFGAQTYAGGAGSNANNQSSSFLTFCLERTEFLNDGSYNVTIDPGAIRGGYSGGNPDPVSNETALLYYTFRTGGAIGTGAFDSVVNSDAESTDLQLAIWYFEGELGANPAITIPAGSRAQNYIDWANAYSAAHNGGSNWGVQVLNLFTVNANGTVTNNQSLLTIVPLPPAAYAGMGTLAGVIGIGAIRRRRLAAI